MDKDLKVGPKGLLGRVHEESIEAWVEEAGALGSPSFNQTSPHQLIFQVTPLSGHQWVVVLQISLPVILLDEALKYLSRNHIDGEWEAPAPPALPASAPRLQKARPGSVSPSVWGEVLLGHQVEGVKGLWCLGPEVSARVGAQGSLVSQQEHRSEPLCLEVLTATSSAQPGSLGPAL